MSESSKCEYFKRFGKNVVGANATFETPYGVKKLLYADWISSGRLYGPIEKTILERFGPMVGNTHSESSETGTTMTMAYHQARRIIKRHVNAGADDVLLTPGHGMTSAVNKFIRILGLKLPETFKKLYIPDTSKLHTDDENRPVVFVSHMEHHSNHTSWLETLADVVVVPPGKSLLLDPDNLAKALKPYKHRKFIYGSFSAASNVTGIINPIHDLAEIMHEHGGFAFVDFAAAAPYVDIDMRPDSISRRLDAIFFSPHKFLGGPGTSGVLVFNRKLYENETPDQPGGGTVEWTDRWGRRRYIGDVEIREDGGTPGFLQTIRTALAIRLKEKMTVEKIAEREEILLEKTFRRLKRVPGVSILADDENVRRIGVVSFRHDSAHHNLIVKLLNDRYGIQVRGGCSCAGTYAHYLLDISIKASEEMTRKISSGDSSAKPGWVRVSLHPLMTDDEVEFIMDAIEEITKRHAEWAKDYIHDKRTNEWFHKTIPPKNPDDFDPWFEI